VRKKLLQKEIVDFFRTTGRRKYQPDSAIHVSSLQTLAPTPRWLGIYDKLTSFAGEVSSDVTELTNVMC